MSIHLVYAHNTLTSFNGKLRNATIEFAHQNNIKVSTSDLVQDGFNPVAGKDDFVHEYNQDDFSLQVEQAQALVNGSFTSSIKLEHDKLKNADFIIFQFPLWWYSMPAILKGYFDKIFSFGFAYGQGGNKLVGKKVILSITTGAPEFMWTKSQKGELSNVLSHLTQGTLEFCGLEVLPLFISYSSKKYNDYESLNQIAKYKKFLNEHIGMNLLSRTLDI